MNLNQIKQFLNNNIETVLSKLHIDYEVLGDNIYSVCPVHESSDNPRAFSFCKKRGIWKCWTRECQNDHKNDIFGLIRGALSNQTGQQITFGNVLTWIKKEFKISLNNHKTKDIVVNAEDTSEEGEEFYDIISAIKDEFNFPTYDNLALKINLTTPSPYFINRGFKPETLKHFGVGDCLDKDSKFYERSIIPIHSDNGDKIIGHICRSTREYKLPKFLIYPKGFDKRFCFYNTHRVLPSIQKKNSVFIVEGQGDVWKLYEAGIYNVLGIFGRTMTREQQKKLQQLPLTHIIILTDNDQAGRESKIQLQRQLGRFYRLSFPKLSHKDIGDMSIKQIHANILSQLKG